MSLPPPPPAPPPNYVLPLSMRFLRTIGGVGCTHCCCCCGNGSGGLSCSSLVSASNIYDGASNDDMVNEPKNSNYSNNNQDPYDNDNVDDTIQVDPTTTTANNAITTTNNNNNNTYNSNTNNINNSTPLRRRRRPSTPSWSITEQILLDYHHTCRLYACDVDVGILTTLRFHSHNSHHRHHTLTISNGHFSDAHLLAICDVLLKYGNGPLSYITQYDFSRGGGSGGNRHGHHAALDVVASATRRKSRHAVHSTGFGSHGAVALAQWIRSSQYMTELNIDRNPIGPAGAAVIFQACTQNTALLKLSARRCQVNEGGALAFATTILAQKQEQYDTALLQQQQQQQAQPQQPQPQQDSTTNHHTPPCSRLEVVDLSANRIGYRGCMAIDAAMTQLHTSYSSLIQLQHENNNNDNTNHENQPPKHRFQISPLLQLDMEGNLVLQEVMNSITHGCGIILAVIASVIMMNRVLRRRRHDDSYASPRHVVSCTIYSISLIVLYTSSTLYHSFFTLRHTKYVFEVIDKCAIYILIAGSYTPFLQIVLSRHALYSYGLLSFLWLLCGLGVTVEFMYPIWKYKGRFSLFMFLCMGWSALICIPQVARIIPSRALHLMTLGGLSYTAGVPFFVRNNNLDHAIWHVFVLGGSIFHWCGVYFYVVPLQ